MEVQVLQVLVAEQENPEALVARELVVLAALVARAAYQDPQGVQEQAEQMERLELPVPQVLQEVQALVEGKGPVAPREVRVRVVLLEIQVQVVLQVTQVLLVRRVPLVLLELGVLTLLPLQPPLHG